MLMQTASLVLCWQLTNTNEENDSAFYKITLVFYLSHCYSIAWDRL